MRRFFSPFCLLNSPSGAEILFGDWRISCWYIIVSHLYSKSLCSYRVNTAMNRMFVDDCVHLSQCVYPIELNFLSSFLRHWIWKTNIISTESKNLPTNNPESNKKIASTFEGNSGSGWIPRCTFIGTGEYFVAIFLGELIGVVEAIRKDLRLWFCLEKKSIRTSSIFFQTWKKKVSSFGKKKIIGPSEKKNRYVL